MLREFGCLNDFRITEIMRYIRNELQLNGYGNQTTKISNITKILTTSLLPRVLANYLGKTKKREL